MAVVDSVPVTEQLQVSTNDYFVDFSGEAAAVPNTLAVGNKVFS